MNHASLPIRLVADLLVAALVVWVELGRLLRLLGEALAPGR